MKLEVRTWNISVRSQSEQRVKATSVKEDGASVIFTDAQGDLVATFRLSEVLGYSIEPKDEIILVVRSVLDESVPDAPTVSEDKGWKVLLPSKKKHHLEAANVLEHDGSAVFTDKHGDLVAKFRLSEVQGYSLETEPLENVAQIK